MLDLKDGPVTIQLLPDVAPRHVERIKTLARRGFYDGTPFHRVIEDFMAQGGDPTGTGTGGARDQAARPAGRVHQPLPLHPRHLRHGAVAATRTAPTASSSSCSRPAPSLDGQYTIWGRVVSGMEAVDKIKRGTGDNGMVQGRTSSLRARIVAA